MPVLRQRQTLEKRVIKRMSNASGTSTRATGRSKKLTFLAEEPEARPNTQWIIDSGASQQLCGKENQFRTYADISIERGIPIADGRKIQAQEMGEMKIVTEAGYITLTDVLYVPDIGKSLMSLSWIIDAGYSVEFGPKRCTVSKDSLQSKLS